MINLPIFFVFSIHVNNEVKSARQVRKVAQAGAPSSAGLSLTWADPEHDLVYVFLSNRIYPDAANRKLITLDIRTRIQEVIYQAYGIQPRPERLPNP